MPAAREREVRRELRDRRFAVPDFTQRSTSPAPAAAEASVLAATGIIASKARLEAELRGANRVDVRRLPDQRRVVPRARAWRRNNSRPRRPPTPRSSRADLLPIDAVAWPRLPR
jgi:hypothetical protein